MEQQFSFEGQVAIITGAAGALGRTYAYEIARRGGAVVANDLGCDFRGQGASPAVDEVVRRITHAGGRAVANYDDVSRETGARSLIDVALETFGRIDVLINNAGNIRNAKFEDFKLEDLRALIDVHLIGSFNVTQAVWPTMKAQGYGRVLLTSSAAGMLGNVTQTGYAAAKAGIIGLMNVLSLEGRPHGILCNALLPSAATRMAGSMLADNIEEIATVTNQFGQALAPENVTPMSIYLVSRACTSTHAIYSAVGNRFCRMFIGMTDGWLAPLDQRPSVEDIGMHFERITDTSHYREPTSLLEEYQIIVTQRTAETGA